MYKQKMTEPNGSFFKFPSVISNKRKQAGVEGKFVRSLRWLFTCAVTFAVAHERWLHFVFRREAQLDIEGQFLVRIIYEDAKTYDLVAAASKVLSK